jgi:hypothetical protein
VLSGKRLQDGFNARAGTMDKVRMFGLTPTPYFGDIIIGVSTNLVSRHTSSWVNRILNKYRWKSWWMA